MISESIKKCSIIIRTKNEERWISSCLSAVFNQTYKNIEVIIVDNESTDRTLERTKKFNNIKYVTISKYLPGDALNKGIEASTGDYIVCLSGHCIPVNKYWLEHLVSALEENENYAGVYGRQEPMSFSTPSDKRDLLLVFGLDRKIQQYDSFFHNANSILHRSLWDKVPFDDQATNIEDRVWGHEMLNLGYKLVYEPEASVYHHHGIHHNGNIERCNNVVKIIQDMQTNEVGQGRLNPDEILIMIKRVLVVGSGGREHALGWKLNQSPNVEKILYAPGNGGTENNCSIKPTDIDGLLKVAKHKNCFTVVGPEVPLGEGIVDRFQEKELPIFGPDKQASQLELSKVFSKKFMQNHGISTANFRVFQNPDDALEYIKSKELPMVIKADGLAAGKGAIICRTLDEARIAKLNGNDGESSFVLCTGSSMFRGTVTGALIPPSEFIARTHIV